MIEPRRYPAAVLFLDLPGEEVDINVHPAKLEVRFKNSREIYDLVSKTVARSLAGAQVSPAALAYRLTPRETTSAASGFWRPKDSYSSSERPREIYSRQNLRQAIDDDLFARAGNPSDVPSHVEEVSCGEKITFTNRKYLGQFADTYLVFGGPDGVMLVDQHAAHERIILERLKVTSATKAVSQPLLMPEVVSLTPAQISLFEGALPMLCDIGLELEIFGRDAIVVKAMPAISAARPAVRYHLRSGRSARRSAGIAVACGAQRKNTGVPGLPCRDQGQCGSFRGGSRRFVP